MIKSKTKWCSARLATVSWGLRYAGCLHIGYSKHCLETVHWKEKLRGNLFPLLSFFSVWSKLNFQEVNGRLHTQCGAPSKFRNYRVVRDPRQWPQALGLSAPKGVWFESLCWQQLQQRKWPRVWGMDEVERIWSLIK